MFYFWACTILPACLYYLINLMMSSTLGLCIGLAVPFICQFLVDRIIRYIFHDYVFGPKSKNKIQDWRYEIFKFLWSQENVLDFLYTGVLQSPLSVHILLPAFTSSHYLLSAATDDSAQLAKKNFFQEMWMFYVRWSVNFGGSAAWPRRPHLDRVGRANKERIIFRL